MSGLLNYRAEPLSAMAQTRGNCGQAAISHNAASEKANLSRPFS